MLINHSDFLHIKQYKHPALYWLMLFALLPSFTSASSADSNSRSAVYDQKSTSGETLLMDAVRIGDAQRVSAILEEGADANKRNAGGVTALMLAAAQGDANIVELLLNAGARPDITDYEGRSAYDRAAQNNHMQLTRILKARAKKVDKSKQVEGYDFVDDAVVDITHPAWFKHSFLDLPEDLEDARSSGKKGIILFMSSRRCSYCKVFLDRVLNDPVIKRRVQANFDVIGMEIFSDNEIIDVDGQSYPVKDFVTKVKASFTPTLLFYGTDGQLQLRIVGYYPQDKFVRVLDYLDGQHFHKETLRDYIMRSKPPKAGATSTMIIDREIFNQPPHVLDRRAARAQQQLMVIFERGDCPSCERLHNKVLNDKSIRHLIGQFEAIQLDITDENNRVITPEGVKLSPGQWYHQLNLNYTPSIVFFNETGKEVMRLDSETLRYRMEGTLQMVLEKAYEKDAQLQRWRRKKAIETIRVEQ